MSFSIIYHSQNCAGSRVGRNLVITVRSQPTIGGGEEVIVASCSLPRPYLKCLACYPPGPYIHCSVLTRV